MIAVRGEAVSAEAPSARAASDQAISDQVLNRVSRSFALSLRALPPPTRPAITAAYLLARAADTLCDTRVLPPSERRQWLQRFRAWIREARPDGALPEALTGAVDIPEERALLDRLPDCFAQLRAVPRAQRRLCQETLGIITSGMALDLARFPAEDSGEVVALESDEALRDYTYRVAGVVGEFWTRIHGEAIPELRRWSDQEQTLKRARAFGRALQLINILKDLPRDLRIGRCYVPAPRLAALGLAPEDLLDPSSSARFAPCWRALLEQAAVDASAGWSYVLSIPAGYRGLLIASALPLVIGIETLDRLARIDPLDLKLRRKIRRGTMLAAMFEALLAAPSRRTLERYWKARLRRAGLDRACSAASLSLG